MAAAENRKIIHVDMDAFYASVEQRDDPTLRGKPIAVGGSPSGRGVVCSASYEARKFGVRSAMSSRRALQQCPSLLFVRPNFSKYKEASRLIRQIFLDVTDLVEPLSLDEAYLDVTENKLGEPVATTIAIYIRERIRKELNLTASAGVAPNKFLAKLASDLKKPDGLFVVSPARVQAVIERLPVEKLWGVGPATAKRMHARGWYTTADLREVGEATLTQQMGRMGGFLFGLACGYDPRTVSAERETKSCGAETTFDNDVRDLAVLEDTLSRLAEKVSQGLQRAQLRGGTVTLKLRYGDFKTITRSRTLSPGSPPIDSATAIAEVARELLRSSTDAGRRSARLIGVSVSQFKREPAGENQLRFDL